jgi:pyroglutamyl-peptidase
MQHTLITGFGPYGSVANNPTMRLAAHFAVNSVPNHRITTFVFPVTYAGVACAMTTLLTSGYEYDNILMLGTNAGADDWNMERYGTNQNDLEAEDADGKYISSIKIVEESPDQLESTIDCDRAVAAIRAAGLPAKVSLDAGRYLCNHLMFVTLSILDSLDASRVKAGFLHVPPDDLTFNKQPDNIRVYSFAEHVKAVEAVLRSLE